MSKETQEIKINERLLNLSEIATICGTTERYARRLLDERRVPTVKLGRLVRVRESDLHKYLMASTRPADTETRNK